MSLMELNNPPQELLAYIVFYWKERVFLVLVLSFVVAQMNSLENAKIEWGPLFTQLKLLRVTPHHLQSSDGLCLNTPSWYVNTASSLRRTLFCIVLFCTNLLIHKKIESKHLPLNLTVLIIRSVSLIRQIA